MCCVLVSVFSGQGSLAGEGKRKTLFALGRGAPASTQAIRSSSQMDQEKQSKTQKKKTEKNKNFGLDDSTSFLHDQRIPFSFCQFYFIFFFFLLAKLFFSGKTSCDFRSYEVRSKSSRFSSRPLAKFAGVLSFSEVQRLDLDKGDLAYQDPEVLKFKVFFFLESLLRSLRYVRSCLLASQRV